MFLQSNKAQQVNKILCYLIPIIDFIKLINLMILTYQLTIYIVFIYYLTI